MIIVLEGPDGSGKTTLANQLVRQTGYPLIHRVAPETEEDLQEMYRSYWDQINAAKNMIFDRAWYSDMCYGPIYRGEATITYRQMYLLEERLARVGGMVIHCTAAPQVLWARCQERKEDNPTGSQKFEEDRDKFGAVVRAYEELMSIPHYIPIVRYEYKEI